MEIKDVYFKNEVKMLNLKTDYKAEEEFGIGDLMNLSQNNELTCDLIYFNFDNKSIPMLVFNRKRYDSTEVDRINGGEIIRKLKYKRDEFKHITSNSKNKLKERFYLEKEYGKEFLIERDLFLSSFTYGETLIIAPNPYMVAFLKDEVESDENSVIWFSMKKNNSEEMMKKLKKRSRTIYDQLKKDIVSLYESFEKDGLYIGGASGPFHSGINMYFLPKEDLGILNKYQILPFDFDEEKGEYVRYEKKVLDQIIKDRINYLKDETSFIKKLNKVKETLKKAGKDWYSLSSVRKFASKDNEDIKIWHVWLNPMAQNRYDSGWYTLEDLKLWAKNEGPIIKKD